VGLVGSIRIGTELGLRGAIVIVQMTSKMSNERVSLSVSSKDELF